MENKNPLVSIIIPVYNVEKYLRVCIDSAINQTYKNIEILLIDDGSTDNSSAICDEYLNEDKKINVTHKKNGGLSSARNTGLIKCNGELVFFLDSDDFIKPDCIEIAVNNIVYNNADISIVDMAFVDEDFNDSTYSFGARQYHTWLMNSEEAISTALYQTKFSCCAPGKLFKRKILGNNPFPEGKLSEDLATCHIFFDKADKIVFIDKIGYFYRQRTASIMHQFNVQRMDALYWSLEIENFCKINYPNIYKAALCRTFNVCVHLLFDISSQAGNNKDINRVIWDNIKRTRKIVTLDTHARKRERYAAFLSYFGSKLLICVWNSGFSIKRKKLK